MDVTDFETVRAVAGDAFSHQLFIWTVSLGVASFIHSGRVRKELRHITTALESMSVALRSDLQSHSKRLAQLEDRVDGIEKGVRLISKTKE